MATGNKLKVPRKSTMAVHLRYNLYSWHIYLNDQLESEPQRIISKFALGFMFAAEIILTKRNMQGEWSGVLLVSW